MERELKIIISARDEATKVLELVGKKTEEVAKTHQKSMSMIDKASQMASKSFGYLKTHTKEIGIAAGGILAGIGALGKSMVDVASDMEQNRIAFETMLGSADLARNKLKELSDFAVKTPFELPQVVEGAKRLLAYNIEAEKLLPTFKMLGDIAAGVGNDKLPNLILAFGQVKAATKLTGMELRQFTEAGVPLLEGLAKQFGTTESKIKDMVSAGEIGFADVEKALLGMTSEGGRFFNLMDRQSKSFGGIIINIRDNFVRFSSDVLGVTQEGDIRQGSIFYYIKLGAEKFLATLDKLRPALVPFFDNLLKNKDTILIIAGAFIGLAAAAAAAAFIIAGKFILIAMALAVVGAYIALTIGKAIEAFNQIKNFVETVIFPFFATLPERIGILINSIILWFQQLPERIGFFLTDLFFIKIPFLIGFIAGWLSIMIPQIVNGIINWFSQLPGTILSIFQSIYNWIIDRVAAAWAWLSEEIPTWPDKIYNFLKSLPGKIKEIFEAVKNEIVGKIKAAWEGMQEWYRKIKDALEWIIDKAKEAYEAVKKGFETGVGFIKGSRQSGGPIFETGPYLLHRGEFVMSRDMLAGRQPVPAYATTNYNSPITINVASVRSMEDIDSIAHRLDFYLRTSGRI